VRAKRWPEDLLALRQEHGLSLVGAVVSEDATALSAFHPPPRLAVLFGAEGPGLGREIQSVCDALVTIPMAKVPAVDSLNVAAAGAVFLYHLTQGAKRDG
jgi:tRNA G18 (ribose-2'-O)-methylase SpoU